MSDANQASLRYITSDAATYGGDPTALDPRKLRYLRDTLELRVQSAQSQEIRTDRITPDVFRTSANEAGDIEGEFSYGTWDDFLGYNMGVTTSGSPPWPDWVAESTPTVAADITITTNNTFTSAGTAIEAGILPDDFIRVHVHTGDGVNAGWYKVASTGTNIITVVGTPLTDESTKAYTFSVGEYIQVGTTKSEVYVERKYEDIASKIMKIRGLIAAGFRIDTARGGPATVRFSWAGKDEDIIPTTLLGTDEGGFPNANPVLQTVDHIHAVVEDGVTYDLSSFSLEGRNGVPQEEVMGQLGPTNTGFGAFEISGDLELYFDATNSLLMDHFHDGSLHGLALVMNDKSLATVGNSYVFDLPGARFTAGRANPEGKDQSVFQRMSFGAKPVVQNPGGTDDQRPIRIYRWDGEA